MKRILLILSLMILFKMSQAQTNTYHKFLGKNLRWSGYFGGYQSPKCHEFTYYIDAFDSLRLDSFLYYAIWYEKNSYPYYYSGPNEGMCNFSSTTYTNSGDMLGWLREDTISKKVYFLNINTMVDKLLYDFSLNIGDTVKSYVTNFCLPSVIVTQIDSILIDGKYRNRWIVNSGTCLSNGEIIEGIGSNMELMEEMVNFEWGGHLVCYYQDSINLYSLTNLSCSLVLTNKENNIQRNIITIYPNPTNSSTTITQTVPTFNRYEIYDINGKLISENKINSTLQKVDLSNYAEGMYVVKLIGKEKVEFKKILVVE